MIKIRSIISELAPGHVCAEISVSSPSELAVTHGEYTFTEGSIAWDIKTGDFYGLADDGNWYKQDGSDAPTQEAVQSNASPQNLSLNSGLNRPVTLEEPEPETEVESYGKLV